MGEFRKTVIKQSQNTQNIIDVSLILRIDLISFFPIFLIFKFFNTRNTNTFNMPTFLCRNLKTMQRSSKMLQQKNKLKYKATFSTDSISNILQNLPIHKPCFCSHQLVIESGKVIGPWESHEIIPFSTRPKRRLPAGIERILGVSDEIKFSREILSCILSKT